MSTNKNNKGFTLVETLLSLITITILSGMLLIVTDLASINYVSLTKDAEAQVLSSILTKTIEDELRYATSLEYSGDEVDKYDYTYFSKSLGLGNACKIISYNGKLVVHQTKDGNNHADDYPLTSDGSYVFDLTADINTTYNHTKKEFDVNLLINDSDGTIMETNFVVIPLNPKDLE